MASWRLALYWGIKVKPSDEKSFGYLNPRPLQPSSLFQLWPDPIWCNLFHAITEKNKNRFFNTILGLSETYRRGRGMSISPVSGRPNEGAGCEKGHFGSCARLAHGIFPRNPTPWGAVRCVKAKGECWLRGGAGGKRSQWSFEWVQAV